MSLNTTFQDLDFTLTDGQLILGASGQVHWETRSSSGVMNASLGFGHEKEEILTIPDSSPAESIIDQLTDLTNILIPDIFEDVNEIIEGLNTEHSLWTRVSDESSTTAWLSIFSKDRVDLIGVQKLSGSFLALEEMEMDSNAELGVYLQLTGGAQGLVTNISRIVINGSVTASANAGLGPISFAGSKGRMILNLETDKLPPLGDLFSDPASLLDGSLGGRLKIEFKNDASVTLMGLSLSSSHTINLDAAVSSLGSQRNLNLDHLLFTHTIELVDNGTSDKLPDGLSLANLQLNAELRNAVLVASTPTVGGSHPVDYVKISGQAEVNFPGSGIFSNSRTLTVNLRFVYDANGDNLIVFESGTDPLPLKDSIFILPASDFTLALVKPDQNDDWDFKIRSRMVLEWEELANTMAEHFKLALLPHTTTNDADTFPVPAMRCSFEAKSENTSTGIDAKVVVGIELVEPILPAQRDPNAAAVDNYVLYSGALGPFPVEISNASFKLEMELNSDGSMSVTDADAVGEVALTSRWDQLGAEELMPSLDNTRCTIKLDIPKDEAGNNMLDKDGNELLPELYFCVEDSSLNGLMLNVPPLVGMAEPISLLKFTSMELVLGHTLALTAKVEFPDTRNHTVFDLLGENTNLPGGWEDMLDNIESAVSHITGRMRLCLPLSEEAGQATCTAPALEVELKADDGVPAFDLFETITNGLISTEDKLEDEDRMAEFKLSELSGDLVGVITIKPKVFGFMVHLPKDEPIELEIKCLVTCSVAGETFDAGLFVELVGGAPRIRLGAGFDDPIRISIPGPKALEDPDWNTIKSSMGVSNTNTLEQLWDTFKVNTSADKNEPFFTFEINDLQLFFNPTDANNLVGLSGGVQIVRFPPLLNDILPSPGPRCVLGATATSVFIEIQPPMADPNATSPEPLVSIPLPTKDINGQLEFDENNAIELILGFFRFGYSWATSSFQLILNAAVNIPSSLTDQTDYLPITYRLPRESNGNPSAYVDLELRQVTASAPPIVLWNFKFGDTTVPHDDILNASGGIATKGNRGLEYVWQIPKFLTGTGKPYELYDIYVRQFSLIPMNLLAQPAVILDWGIQFGPRDASILQIQVRQGTLQTYFGSLALLFPWTLLMPPMPPLPPYRPGGVLGAFSGIPLLDFFTGSPIDKSGKVLVKNEHPAGVSDVGTDHGVQIKGSIPNVINYYAGFSRPVPTASLPALLELSILGKQLFEGTFNPENIADDAAVRDIMYVEADFAFELPLLKAILGETYKHDLLPLEAKDNDVYASGKTSFRIDIIDVLNVITAIGGEVIDGIDEGITKIKNGDPVNNTIESAKLLTEWLEKDQSGLVSLIPYRYRYINICGEEGFSFPGTNFEMTYSIGAHLLLPDELLRELRLYHEHIKQLGSGNPWINQPGSPPASMPPPFDRDRLDLDKLKKRKEVHTAEGTWERKGEVEDPYWYLNHNKKEQKKLEQVVKTAVTKTQDRWATVIAMALVGAWYSKPTERDRKQLIKQILTEEKIDLTVDNVMPMVKTIKKDLSKSEKKQLLDKLAQHIKTADQISSSRKFEITYSLVSAARAEEIATKLLDSFVTTKTITKVEDKTGRIKVTGDEDERIKILSHGIGVSSISSELSKNLDDILLAVDVNKTMNNTDFLKIRKSVSKEINKAVDHHASNLPHFVTISGNSRTRRKKMLVIIMKTTDKLMSYKKVESFRLKKTNLTFSKRQQIVSGEFDTSGGVREKALVKIEDWYKEINVHTKYAKDNKKEVIEKLKTDLAKIIMESGVVSRAKDVERGDLPKTCAIFIKTLNPKPPTHNTSTIYGKWEKERTLFNTGTVVGLLQGALAEDVTIPRYDSGSHLELPSLPDEPSYNVFYQWDTSIDWSISVSHAQPDLQVILKEGKYYLIIDRKAKERHLLPPKVTKTVENGPKKASLLRSRLQVRDIEAVMSKTDINWAEHAGEKSGLHTESIFWNTGCPGAQVYKICNDNGLLKGARGGHFNLADLLVQKDGSSFTYLIPDRPILLAGMDLTVLSSNHVDNLSNDFKVGLRGIVLPSLDKPKNHSIFMSGFVDQTLKFGEIDVHLRGEFRWIQGPLWDEITVSNILNNLTDDFSALPAAGGVAFSGEVLIERDSKELFSGSASGLFTNEGLELEVNIDITLDNIKVSPNEGLITGLSGSEKVDEILSTSFTYNSDLTATLKLKPGNCTLEITGSISFSGDISYSKSKSVETITKTCDLFGNIVTEILTEENSEFEEIVEGVTDWWCTYITTFIDTVLPDIEVFNVIETTIILPSNSFEVSSFERLEWNDIPQSVSLFG